MPSEAFEAWWASIEGDLKDTTSLRVVASLGWYTREAQLDRERLDAQRLHNCAVNRAREYARNRPPLWRYTLHNLVGHPLMELLHHLRLRRAARWVHTVTLPKMIRQDPLWAQVEAGEYFGCL
jgi:hypothetical protein